MVNGTVDKNNISSKPDEESVKHSRKSKAEVVSSSSSDSATPVSRKSSSSGVSSGNDHEKIGLGGEGVGSRAMAEVPTKTSLFCSVPLNKIRSVLSNASGKIDEDENSSKFTQISRKLLCLYCDRTFVSSNLRQKHVERCHSEKQSRRLSSRKLQSQFTTTACLHCDKLPDEHSLRQLFEHLISAHSQKYFGCLLCEERFLNQIQLNDHNTKLHNSTKKEQKKIHVVKVDEGLEKSDKANKTLNSKSEESKDGEQKSSKNKVKKKKAKTNSKPPTRQLRNNKKKVSIKASKVGLKRSTRLQSARNKVPVRKKRTKTAETVKSEESNIKTIEKTKSSSINPYPEFDSYYRVKKITDHSIDNLKISSLTFDDVFDKAFFNRIKCNIQENLLHHLDGKLFKNEESESRISNFEKNPPTQDVSNTTSENFGCDLSLNAITPVTSILAANFGEDLESQIEYGSKPSKKKLQIRQDPVRHKYVTRRKYQASILEHKENRDLSKLDMWTQLVIKDRQQKELNGKKSAKEMLEYTTCAEYKLKIQRNELNRILDRRGPFEDLKEEASKKAALEQLNSESSDEVSEACFKEVRSLMEDLLTEIVRNCSEDEDESINVAKLNDRTEYLEKEDIPELPDYLKLRRTSLVPSEEEIDKSDKIALICSSQETENYELPTNTVRNKNEMVELSGEWARSRIYVCAACGLKVSNMKLLIDHKSMYHQNSWVQHYELVGNQSELYRHLCIPGLGKVGHIEETVPCKSWLKSDSRVCTKCGKVCNSLSELHRHILECGGDWTWMLARKKCKYRPFGARKKRRGLVKRIRVSNQKTDQTEKKKYKKTFEGPRQRPSDADTIQRMLANLPPKRSSRKSICMKDGFTRKRQKSPKNKKQVMKCGKIVRHKSTYNTNLETTKNPNHKNTSVRQTLRSISRTLSSKILDTNSKLKVKRQLIQNINRRSPRKNSRQISETSDQVSKNEENEEKTQNIKTTNGNVKIKRKADLDKVKSVLKEKVNIKSFFPVSKRKQSTNNTKTTENSISDSSQHAQNIEVNKDIDATKQNTTKSVIKVIKKSLNLHRKVKANSKIDPNLGNNSEPIVVIEKLPPAQRSEGKPSTSSTSKKAPNKRKLRSSFRKVIDKVKKLKLDNNATSVPNDKKEMNVKNVNSFLGQGAREKEKLATVLVPLVEESKESPLSNLAFVQNAMDNNSPTEESLIPENIFNLQHNSEDLLQAKSPVDTITNDVKKNEVNKYLSTMSAKISHMPETTKEANVRTIKIDMKNDVLKSSEDETGCYEAKNQHDNITQNQDMSLLSIETTVKSDKTPLISPVLSPSLLSPKTKGKLRKPSRGLNDCIAMLTKKAFEETHKTEIVPDSGKSSENSNCSDNTNEAHKIIRANECILKIPVIESQSQIQTEVLDLSKPKMNIVSTNISQKNTIDLPTSKSTSLWNPVNDILCSNQTSSLDDSKIIWPVSSSKIQNITVNSNTQKAILKIPKFVEISRSNNVDNVIQGVIENYDEPVTNKSETVKPYLKVPSIGLLNSVDEIIEEVVKGNLILPSNEVTSTMKMKSSVDKKDTPKGNKIIALNTTSGKRKTTRKNKRENKSSNTDKTSTNASNNSLCSNDHSENINTSQEEGNILDVVQFISTPSTDSAELEKRIVESHLSVNSSESKLSEKSSKDEEFDSAVTLNEDKNQYNSQIADVNLLDSVPVDIIPKKKSNSQGKKEATKKSLNTTDNEMEDGNLKEEDEAKVSLNKTTKVPSLLQSKELDISEDKKIPSSDEIKFVYEDPLLSKPEIPNSVPIAESLNSLQEEPSIHHKSEILSEKEFSVGIEDNDDKRKSTQSKSEYSPTSLNVDENKLEDFSYKCNTEKNFKSNATDSEDELPLLILKSRNKKHSLKEIPEALEDTKKNNIILENEATISVLPTEMNNITLENEAITRALSESAEMNSENYKEETTKTVNTDPLNTLINISFTKENEKFSHSTFSSDREPSETIPSDTFNKRKSSRRASNSNNPNKQGKRSKKTNKRTKSKHASKFKIIKHLDEILKKEEVLGNISNTIDIANSKECGTDVSEKEKIKSDSVEEGLAPLALEVTEAAEKSEIILAQSNADTDDIEAFKNIQTEQNVSPKTLSTLEVSNKPKNFLVDTNACNYRNNTTNTSASLLKSTKTKKKNKNKQDSIKTKLIFKFPKIILKEPILRIPPRDNISESTSGFGPTMENSQDKSIKLILENPFSNTKALEDKLPSISTVTESLGKSTKNELMVKTKSSNKKKSNKHKKRLLKSLTRGGSMSEIIELRNATSEESKNYSFSNESANEKDISVSENFQSLPDNFNIPSASQYFTKVPTDSLPETSKLLNSTLKLPITLKLQPNALKKSKSKNLKRKKDKVKKSNPASDKSNVDEKVNGNDNFSDVEKSNILSNENFTKSIDIQNLLPSTQILENIGYVEKSLVAKSENKIEFETEGNKSVYTSPPEIPHDSFIPKPQNDQENMSEDQTSYCKLSTVSSIEKIEAENEGHTPVKMGRSLRSTVKITYKQSNIFALQIEDKEISDLKIIEKPKYLESQNVSSNDIATILVTNQNAVEVPSGQHEEQIAIKGVSDHESLIKEGTVVLNKKRVNSKEVETNCQEVEILNEKVGKSLFTVSNQMITKKSNEYKDVKSFENQSELMLETQLLEKGVKTKSKKSRRSAKAKKLSDKILETKSTVDTECVVRNSQNDIYVENEGLDKITFVNETYGKIVNVVDRNDLIQEAMSEQNVDISDKISLETHENKEFEDPIFATSNKYDDLSFSEGELVINESFESIESNILEESLDDDKKLEVVAPEINNFMQENVQINSSSDTVEQKKSQKNKKHKREKSSKFPKKLNLINHSSQTIEPNNQDEIPSAEINEVPLDGSETKMQFVMGISKSTDCDFKEKDITEASHRISSYDKLVLEKKDEFEFEEDIEPIDNLKSKFKIKKTKDDKYQDIVEKSTSLCEEKVETMTSLVLSATSNGRRHRTAKTKALESINIIEKNLEEILDTELKDKGKPCTPLKHKNKVTKNKEIITDKILDNESIEKSLEGEEFRDISSVTTPQRKSRAAKAKAIENIKISEMKASDLEEGNKSLKKTSITDSSEKVKKTFKSRDKKSSNMESYEIKLLNFQNNEKNSVEEPLTTEENKSLSNQKALVPSILFSTLIEECTPLSQEVHKSANIQKIIEMDSIDRNSDIQYELSKELKKNAKVKEIIENELVLKTCSKDESTSNMEGHKSSKSTVSSIVNSMKEKNGEGSGNIEIYNKNEMDDINSSSLIKSYSLTDSLSTDISASSYNIYQKRKRSDSIAGDLEIIKKTDEINCYNINNIEKVNHFESKISSFPPSKKKKKSNKHGKKIRVDIKEELVNASSAEVHSEKAVESIEPEHLHDISKGTGLLETKLVNSLDVTLKTTVDEISFILMEDKQPMGVPSSDTSIKFRENIVSESERSSYEEKHSSAKLRSTQKPDEFLDETSKNEIIADDCEISPLKGNDKTSIIETKVIVELGSKRRSRRACKVNTYNENFLAEAVFEPAEKADKKRGDEKSHSAGITTTNNTIPNDISPEKKLNSDELFDLLKATAPDNLIALKPVEENPSDTPHTDDNFDDEFDDILRKSQALFGEKPYKKLDDICRSDDSSSTSKLTDFEKLDENTETNVEADKSVQSYISETTFSNSIISVDKNDAKKSEELTNSQSDDLYCDICRKTFKRIDNLIKHRTTLTHIAKLSEMEAKEAQNKSIEVPGIEDSSSLNDVTVGSKGHINSSGYSYSSNAENNALKIAEIITEAFEEPNAHADGGFSEVVTPLLEYRRYKSLGERKSFEYEQGSPNISENIEANPYDPKMSNNTGVILEKQINLLQNIVGFDCANDGSTSSYHSLGNSIGRDSPVSVFSSKLEDSTNLVFPNDLYLDGETGRRSKDEDFLKPPQIEDISEDSINVRNSDDIKSRKVLNRDEELFLECCSLLKSGSEVSNFSKKSNRNSLLHNVSIKMTDEPDVLESKNLIYKVTDDSSDISRRATPLGDSFGDTSNSNTISSSWEMNKNDLPHKNQENPFNFCDTEKYRANNDRSFCSSKFNELVSTDGPKSSPTKNRKSTSDLKVSHKGEEIPNSPSSKMPTKGALKIFEGLKVSIPTNELNLEMLKKRSVINKSENNSQKVPSDQQFISPKTPRRKSKPVKNKPQIDDRFIFKVNKKPTSKDTEEANSNMTKESLNDKITDVYDFEETQDNTDVFAKPDFKSFRTKGTETVKGEIMLENNYEIQTMSSSSSSTLSGKKTNECITKKKHMIMGRIFKNAVKPKLDEEIRDIPPIDHNELVENYVMSCTPKHEEEFKKPKMTEEEMDYLFDKLLDKPIEQPKKSGSPSKTDCKNTGMKKKLKMKCKKRQRSNSDSTDDEFGLNKIVKKRPNRKNAKEEDNSINLEQELKECIGVASRKSQRKCTSGKQNVLVEYWSSDESAFETFLENHLQELSEKSDIHISKDVADKKENEILPSVAKENLPKTSTSEKTKKPKTKHKVFSKKKESKELSTSNEITESSVQSNRRKRTAAHPLYHWSSSSEDELQDLIEVKSIRDDPEDEYDEERPVQHGWIVGDSPKKLVTMLAQAKGKKTEPESFVKEQGKKKNSNS